MLALTRDISSAVGSCQLTHQTRESIDLPLARAQHEEYERALRSLGCDVRRLTADETMPDSVFIEDTAVVLPEIAIIARPGAESRRAEVDAVAAALEPLRRLVHIAAPGTLDGGDVLVIGRTIFVGRSIRTNDSGVEQLRAAAAPFGYAVEPVSTSGCLHLKSAVTLVDARTVVINPNWVSREPFQVFRQIDIDPGEPGAANIVAIGDGVIASAAFPGTCARLEGHGVRVTRVDASELAKAEGALTCCSILVS